MDVSYFWGLEGDIPPGIGVAHFSDVHLLWLGSILAIGAAVSLLFWRMRSSARSWLLRCCAGALLVLETVRIVWLVGSGRFDPQYMLPLHLCGLMLFLEAGAVFSQNAILKELSYCLGMPGAFFALLTPESTVYPLFNLWYLLFIATHLLLTLIPVLFLIDGFRPDRRRLPACLGALLAMVAVDLLANWLLDANYLFLNRPPPGSPLALFEGFSQPAYLLCCILLLLTVWGILYLPWGQTRANKY